FFRQPVGLASFAAFVLIGSLVLLAPVVSPYAPEVQIRGEELLPPRPGFWFGTDDLGRDILSRCLYGAQLSLATVFLAAFLAGVVGTALGTIAGFLRGKTDSVLGRIFDTILAFPGLLLGLMVAVF